MKITEYPAYAAPVSAAGIAYLQVILVHVGQVLQNQIVDGLYQGIRRGIENLFKVVVKLNPGVGIEKLAVGFFDGFHAI